MKRGWFGPKQIGWGATARSWEGWAATAAMLAVLAAAIRWLRPVLEDATGLSPLMVTAIFVVTWLLLFLAVIWLTWERKT
jgi:hypothetical protein